MNTGIFRFPFTAMLSLAKRGYMPAITIMPRSMCLSECWCEIASKQDPSNIHDNRMKLHQKLASQRGLYTAEQY
jgi:hypothetical protein